MTVCVSWWCVVLSNSFSYVYELLICHATLFSLPSFHVTKLKCPLTCPDAKLAKASYSLWIVMQNLLKHHTVYELWCKTDQSIIQPTNCDAILTRKSGSLWILLFFLTNASLIFSYLEIKKSRSEIHEICTNLQPTDIQSLTYNPQIIPLSSLAITYEKAVRQSLSRIIVRLQPPSLWA